MIVQWQDSLSVGVSMIDSQHQELINRVNELLEASRKGKGRDEIGRILDFLGTYVVQHFAAEERLMLEHKYPEYPAHQQKHQAFLADFGGLRYQFQTEGATPLLVIQVQRRVVDWLLTHIQKEDRRIAEFLRHAH